MENPNVGGSAIKVFPPIHTGVDREAFATVKSGTPLNVDLGFNFSNRGSKMGEGFCNINYVELYTGLLSRLKYDLIGVHIPELNSDLQ